MKLTLKVIVIFVMLSSLIAGLEVVNADSQTRPPIVSGINIVSPLNSTYTSKLQILTVNISALKGIELKISLNYSLDGVYKGEIPITSAIEPHYGTITYANGTTTTGVSVLSPIITSGAVNLTELSEGNHTLTVYAKYNYPNTNRFVTPYAGTVTYYENSTIFFTIDLNPTKPPTITSLSIENKTYSSNNIPLSFNIDKAWSNITYRLDSQANKIVTENFILTGLTDGAHNLIIFANDTAGNVGKSNTISFTVDTTAPSPFPTYTPTQQPTLSPSPSAIVDVHSYNNQLPYLVGISLIAIGVTSLLAYFKKRNR